MFENRVDEKETSVKRDCYISVTAAAIAGLITFLLYLQALSCGFVIMDDPIYVLNNPLIRTLDLDFFTSVFTRTYIGWWMPLTWVSLAIDYHFWELDPVGYHLTNILLHAVNTGLVVLIADRIFKRQRPRDGGKYLYPAVLLLSGLLWGIHPLRIESVAWVAERKDVLNGVFALGSVLFYLQYAQHKESGRGARYAALLYLVSFVLFILSLMAKSVSVVIPAILLALDRFPLERLTGKGIRAVLMEKLPFLAVSAAMVAVTFYFSAEARFLVSNDNFPLWQRVIVSGNAVFEYCRLLIYPAGIVPLHLIPDPIPGAYTIKAFIAAALMLFCIITGINGVGRLSVMLCFILPLLPVLAFFQNGDQAFAARFTYLPSVAPCVAAAFLFAAACRKVRDEQPALLSAMRGAAVLLLLFYAGMTYRLIPVWNSPETYWNRVVEVEPSAIAFKERALLFVSLGKYDAAVRDYTAAIMSPVSVWLPYVYNLYALRGEASARAGRYDDAVKDYSAAIEMCPHPAYYRLRAAALRESGKAEAAREDLVMAGDTFTPLAWYWDKCRLPGPAAVK